MTERIIHRREEEGDRKLRQDPWRRTETKERAEQQCRTVRLIYHNYHEFGYKIRLM